MHSKDLSDKLEKVERTINIYSNETKEEVEEVPINMHLEKLRSIIMPREGDRMLYMGYVLNAAQLNEINQGLNGLIKPDFGLYYYVLECHGVYNW